MQLVMLAAGRGTRFGGLKQIAAVGPRGEAVMDYTARFAEEAGFGPVVLVVRPETRDVITSHVARFWPASLAVETVVQSGATAGTVPAVLAARGMIEGSFGVVNADDLYEGSALVLLYDQLSFGPAHAHVLVSYQLVRTVLTAEPVKRGLCVEGPPGVLADLVEHHVRLRADGGFDAWPLEVGDTHAGARILGGFEPVSMNLWGFRVTAMDVFEEAVAHGATDGEILLPEVVGHLARQGREQVRLCPTTSRCMGLTYREDVVPLQEQLAALSVTGGSRS